MTTTPHIVYLHGLNCTRRIFTYLHSQLPTHTATLINYASSKHVEESYQAIMQSIPTNEPITIIGHSLGGILGHLITTRNPKLTVKHLISIATPFGGSATASHLKWIYPSYTVFKDIGPGSKLIREVTTVHVSPTRFTSLITTSGHLPFISGHNDGVVSIRSQEATLAHEVIRIDACHYEILQDPQTIAEIKRIVF